MAGVGHYLGQIYCHDLPNPGLAPPTEPSIDGVPAAVFGRHVAPWRATPEPPEYAVDDRAVLLGTPATAPVLTLDRQQVRQDAPFRLSEIAPAQACLQKTALNQPTVIRSTCGRRYGGKEPNRLCLPDELGRLHDRVRVRQRNLYLAGPSSGSWRSDKRVGRPVTKGTAH